MDTQIVLFKEEGGWFGIDVGALGFRLLAGKDGSIYLAVGALGVPDNHARVCRSFFKDCWREVFKKEGLSLNDVVREWRKSFYGNKEKESGKAVPV